MRAIERGIETAQKGVNMVIVVIQKCAIAMTLPHRMPGDLKKKRIVAWMIFDKKNDVCVVGIFRERVLAKRIKRRAFFHPLGLKVIWVERT